MSDDAPPKTPWRQKRPRPPLPPVLTPPLPPYSNYDVDRCLRRIAAFGKQGFVRRGTLYETIDNMLEDVDLVDLCLRAGFVWRTRVWRNWAQDVLDVFHLTDEGKRVSPKRSYAETDPLRNTVNERAPNDYLEKSAWRNRGK